MEYTEIMHQITSGLSGEWKKDIGYLQAKVEEYREHPLGFEIARGIGRLLYEVLPAGEKTEFNILFQKYVFYQETVLSEVKNKIRDRDIMGAERLLLNVLPSDDSFREDAVSVYLSFKTPLEYYYYLYKFKPQKKVRNPPFPFNEVYELYSYILVEKKEFAAAIPVFDKALVRSPLNKFFFFERAEIFKVLKDMTTFKKLNEDILQYLYRREDVSKYFRNLGYYFIECRQWDAAVSAYTASMWWCPSEMAAGQLYYIVKQTGKVHKNDDIGECLKILEGEGVNIEPDPEWMRIAWWLGGKAFEDKDLDLAAYCYGVVSDFTGDKEAEAKRQECIKGH